MAKKVAEANRFIKKGTEYCQMRMRFNHFWRDESNQWDVFVGGGEDLRAWSQISAPRLIKAFVAPQTRPTPIIFSMCLSFSVRLRSKFLNLSLSLSLYRIMKSKTEMSENRFLGSISASTIRNFLPRSVSGKNKTNSTLTKSRSNNENTPPSTDPNIQVDNGPSIPQKSQSKMKTLQQDVIRSDDLPQVPTLQDPAVKVVVRIRPIKGHEREGDQMMVKKDSGDSVSIGNRKFSFDSVVDSNSKQENIFQLVGVPLVKDALAGYNTSILAYGQTGSGKTYTMWGPPSAIVEGPSANSTQGIVPRIFQMLFSEIQREQEISEGKQITYQCRCSFLEVYNDQIGDLLDATQRNLEIKDDAKNGFYVENLTEEYVTSYEDVTQVLIKGLSSRKVGATSINSKSSRSHVVFTCIIESWCKGNSSRCFGSSKTSRITLVDLAGLEKNKVEDSNIQCVKEGKSVKKALAQLGRLVNFLAEGTQSRKPEEIPYRCSSLTNLLRESLGGNAKLAVICTISPDNKSNCETLSTLRFGQRVKSIQNDPVINEITEDDVNDLSDRIRQLKEELIRAKSNGSNSIGSNYGYFRGRNARESLNQLRLSLNRSLILPSLEHDSEEEVTVCEDDVEELRIQLDNLQSSFEENKDTSENKDCTQFSPLEEDFETSEHDTSCLEQSDIEDITSEKTQTEHSEEDFKSVPNTFRTSISIRALHQSSILEEPTLSESPKIGNTQRKSLIFSSNLASQNIVSESSKLNSDVLRQSHNRIDHIRSSLQSSKIFPSPTESLAASLQRGLQIIDHHQQNSALDKSPLAFSFEHLMLKPCPAVDTHNASVQTLPEEKPSLDGPSDFFVCSSCRRAGNSDFMEVKDSLNTSIIAVDETGNTNQMSKQDAGIDLAVAKKREELEKICMEQAVKIEHLNSLVEQYKHEREENTKPERGITLLVEDSKNEIVPIDENKLLKWDDSENHEPEIMKEKCETNEISFDLNEKEALLKEIQSLRSKLQSHTDSSPKISTERLRSSLLSQSIQLRKSGAFSRANSDEELEKERERWMEMESDWISLTDELRIDIESNRQRAEKVEMELRLEKKCSEELDDALQRSVLGHARMIEHYVELQEKYNDLLGKHRMIMEGIAEVKRAAAKAGAKGHGSRFAKSLATELSVLRVERERERELLKKENRSLKIQLRDTAEAVHAAGELLVRLREAEQAASVSEESFTQVQDENEKLKKQVEKLKRKHKMEMITMKQYLAESRLPESALQPSLFREDSDISHNSTTVPDDDQAWRAEFGAIYQNHY